MLGLLHRRHLLTKCVQGFDVHARRYLAVKPVYRNTDYAEVSDTDLDYFKEVIGPHGVVTDADALDPLNRYTTQL
jgi:hypothetical protein